MRRFFMAILLISIVTTVLFSCHPNESVLVNSPSSTKTADRVFNDSQVVTKYFNSENLYTIQKLDEAMCKAEVQLEVERFNSAGYAYAPEHSFTFEGQTQNGTAEISIITLSNILFENKDAIYLAYITTDEVNCVVPGKITFDIPPEGAGFELIGENTWFKAIQPLTENTGLINLSSAKFSWRKWWHCTWRGGLAAAYGCLIPCLLSGPAYFKCYLLCSGGGILGSAVACALHQM